jgi:hypothetical protein
LKLKLTLMKSGACALGDLHIIPSVNVMSSLTMLPP